MITGFARYSRDRSFEVLGRSRKFVAIMAAGSIVGSSVGRAVARAGFELVCIGAALEDNCVSTLKAHLDAAEKAWASPR